MLGDMELARQDAVAFLNGIENHARAGNFDQVSLQTQGLLDRLRNSDADEYRDALPAIRELLGDSSRSDARAIIEHVHQAQVALGFAPH
jgi:hypothetical protein